MKHIKITKTEEIKKALKIEKLNEKRQDEFSDDNEEIDKDE